MPNIAARSAVPYVPNLMREIGATEKTAAALQKLRTDAQLSRPGNVTIQKLVYNYALVQRDMAMAVVDIFNYHLKKLSKPILNEHAIVDFDCYILGFGPCLNTLETEARDPENDPIAMIATISGYTVDVIISLKKKRLVPYIVAKEVMDAVIGKFKYSGTLSVKSLQLNEFSLEPLAVEAGRKDIFQIFSEKKLDIYR